MTQYHHLDESGDPGSIDTAGASSQYVLAMLQMAEHAPIPELAAVRRALYLPPLFEFKYYTTTPTQKRVLFDAFQALPFRVRCAALDKSKLPVDWARLSGQALTVELIVRLTLRASALDIANDMLIIDGGTPALRRAVRVRLSDECRKTGRVRPFGKIVGGRSLREDGLQVADMIAGAIRQHRMGAESSYYRTFADKIADWWAIP